ncbi:MAG: copper-binding protein [Gammaproteobacteria bacterium]|nr:MAG: copper-binding protein [Gammaproteobacteria bacterium]
MMKPFHLLAPLALLALLGGCSDDEGVAPQGQAGSRPAVQTAAPATQPAPEPEPGVPGESPAGDAATPDPGNAATPDPAPTAAGQPAATGGETHVVKAVVTQFVPPVIFIQPGDTVHWTNMNGHNTHSIDGLIPEGAQPWQSKLGEDYSLTLTVPGAYIYKCDPHYSLGMVGAIVVGPVPPANLEALEKSPANKGMARRAFRMLKKAIAERH